MCSDMGMGEDESLKKTIECLRGRLVAERQHSKIANENADQLIVKVSPFLSPLSTMRQLMMETAGIMSPTLHGEKLISNRSHGIFPAKKKEREREENEGFL
ncbi:hypothetical protein SAY87_009059 [Trapa incisa]|uniref:Uncharacterized protein n=1 Tax=Trapa incisa TaxID=236973 RepID=A0AAN7JY49_9MYRT|nr:hypothetical protein SAY87_009059 [Trapa incisa]